MKILVQKFGGTSVSTHERRLNAVNKIIKAKEKGYLPVVVVSAMGRKNEAYATDTLISLVSEKFKIKNSLATDLLMSCGEIISTVVMCQELFEFGLEGAPLTGGQAGIITDENYNNAKVLRVNTENIINIIKDNKIPVVAGFQGKSENGFITTIGRGGSDVTAALLGVALNAREVQIFTDVDGIMTADPRIVGNAALIKEMDYSEVFQFADQGAKVIHPRAVEIAMKGNIPLVIKNTMSDCEGTIINNTSLEKIGSVITGITHVSDRVQIKITHVDNKNNDNYEELFDRLAENLISIDLINVFPKEKIFTIDGKDLEKFRDIMEKLSVMYTYIDNCSKIAVIGSRIRGVPGIMAKVLRALIGENIQVLQTADSHTTIWCLVGTNSVQAAINALHKEFKLGK